MATGLDVATGVAGLISLSVTLFHGCVQAFSLISSAKHLGHDAERVRCMLDWEQYRLLQWGERTGLDGTAVQDRKFNWSLITDILRQLQGLLTDAKVLRERYNLDIIDVDADDASTASTQSPSMSEVLTQRKGIGRLWSYVRPDLQTVRARIIQENNGPMKKLRWAALDQDKVRTLIGDIGYFNNSLHDMLESAEQHFVRATLSALLRDLVSRSTLPSDLDIIKALLDSNYIAGSSSIEAAASLKQIRLLLSIDRRLDEKSVPRTRSLQPDSVRNGCSGEPAKQTLSKLSYRSLVRDSDTSNANNREIAAYKSSRKNINSQVLVEWKPVEKELEERLKRRIEGLTLLMSNNSDPSFHSLKCLGFLRHETEGSTNMYAYIYEVANLDEEDLPHPTASLRPLSSLFDNAKTPSLTYRMRLAMTLAETILQLHTSGWLHKAIRSENVLFLDRGPYTWDNGTSLGPYVAGYEYARADNPLELTEEAPSSLAVDLYRHPEAQGIARPSFKKAFDLYATGCVLIEIALWKSLQDILFHAGNCSKTPFKIGAAPNTEEQVHLKWSAIARGKERLLDQERNSGILDQVAFHAGDQYRAVVRMCLLASADSKDAAGDDDDDDAEASVRTQIDIVKMLEQVSC
ncbi:MAG: hypothetical protein M1830_007499 [Pleopsidium flavum]|nr:MAG: hypothetical protein M1830_007499 [Pleopsidium flavum]